MKEEVKVTRVGNKYCARYVVGNVVVSEWRCELKEDIGYMCREMLRWRDKLGHATPYTSSARRRQKLTRKGKVERVK